MSGTDVALVPGMHGNQTGRFEVFESIGKGGMAVVHRAVQRGVGDFRRTVALKRMLPHLSAKPALVERFVSEATVGSQLSHPNIAQVYDFGQSGEQYFIAMELVEGLSLSQLIRRATKAGKPIPIRVVVSILRQLASALDHLHLRVDELGQPLGLAHRDISPSNIMISREGHVKLIDFGVAAPLQSAEQGVVGKLAYMAPEEISGAGVDPRSDLWALGVIAWELVTSTRLFATGSDYATVQRVLHAPIPAPSEIEPTCPLELDLLILAALTRHPNARAQSASELIVDIDDFATSARLNINASVIATWLERESFTARPERGQPPTPVTSAAQRPAEVTIAAIERVRCVRPERAPDPPSVSWSKASDVEIGVRLAGAGRSRWLSVAASTLAAIVVSAVLVRGSGVARSTPVVAAELKTPPVQKELPLPERSSATLEPEAREPSPPKRIVAIRQRERSKRATTAEPTASPARARERPPHRLSVVSNLSVQHLPVLAKEPKASRRPQHPRVVRPNAVRKLAGTLPSLRLRRDSLERSDGAYVSARLCTNANGRVASVSILTSVDPRANRQVRAALKKWRFSRFVEDGAALPVCFSRQFRVQAR